ncbi:beta-N-acetylhexosaminidase [Limnohabitans sp.]|uniref:beta-N-acetylhexosaminidase n=1 Tax=Limnohabitans sp. TaxID=1907725 RepID=UPI003919CBB9
MSLHAPLILDIAGTALTGVDRRRLAHPLTGGLILFGRNWQSRAQLTALCAEVKSLRPDLLIAVDHEGGRVQRFRTDGFTHLPPMRAFGDMWMRDVKDLPGTGALQACEAATSAGFVLASELRACGVDFSFTPVLDLDHVDEAPTIGQALAAPQGGSGSLGRPGVSRSGVIGDRAFARDPRMVTLLARSLMHGLLQAGMANCGKHFPGHGAVKADSHVALPVDRRSLKAILSDDALPYTWLGSVLTAVMPAHVIYSRVDDRPAGFSKRWIQDILRGRLGFDGVVCTDDLSMAAARQIAGRELSYTEAVLTALQAGCDLAMLCNRSVVNGGEELDTVLDELAQAQLKGHWEPDEASEERRLGLLPRSPARPWEELVRSRDYMQALDRLP